MNLWKVSNKKIGPSKYPVGLSHGGIFFDASYIGTQREKTFQDDIKSREFFKRSGINLEDAIRATVNELPSCSPRSENN